MISSRLSFLAKHNLLPAEAWDFVHPHGPVFSVATKEYAMAGIVRDIANNLPDESMQKRVLSIGRSMVEFASKGLINGWEEGDDICPPWPPFPWPWPGPWPVDPDPVPWHTLTEGIREYAKALKLIARMSAVPEVAKQLNEIAGSLGKR
jgi:hypothetical protein